MKNKTNLLAEISAFFKQEAVLCIASLLALVSAFVVPPNKEYIGYIDFHVLSLLFCLMLVVAGLQKEWVFEKVMQALSKVVKTKRQLYLVLILACFFFGMWITNDVALITFVPFAIMMLTRTQNQKYLSYVIVMQTVAANLGSMCTPIGNPQNLYLYTISAMPIGEFLKILFPYTIISLFLLVVSAFYVPKEELSMRKEQMPEIPDTNTKKRTVKLTFYAILFILCMLTVLHILHYLVTLAVVIIVIALMEPKLFKDADYMLLLTFIAFFVFVGNMKQIEVVCELIGKYLIGNEIVGAVVVSQFISNVPAAVLLSGFTDKYQALLIGTNIGGLGTIIASMASLISYKLYAKTQDCKKGKYMLLFTGVNLIFLVVMLAAVVILN